MITAHQKAQLTALHDLGNGMQHHAILTSIDGVVDFTTISRIREFAEDAIAIADQLERGE